MTKFAYQDELDKCKVDHDNHICPGINDINPCPWCVIEDIISKLKEEKDDVQQSDSKKY